MTRLASAQERLARAALSFITEPGDPALGLLLRAMAPAEVVAMLRGGGGPPAAAAPPGDQGARAAARAVERWRARLDQVPTQARLAAWDAPGCGWCARASRNGRRSLMSSVRQAP
jgi:hypothetical protein